MKRQMMVGNAFPASSIALGCMRIANRSDQDAANLIQTAMDAGIDFFDHADIYGNGRSEEVFARAIKKAGIGRDKIKVQIKCGIRDGFFDFSKEHILDSADKCLKRLDMDYADTLLLHRPDTLMEPEEVAEAFSKLSQSGKVRHFGVSNHNPAQIKLLNQYLKRPLIINQLQFSLTNTGMIDSGLNVNMQNPPSVDHDGSVLEFSRIEHITIQAWSPFQYGFFSGVFIDNDKFPELNQKLDELAAAKQVSKEAVAIAWILRHPAGIQPILGTTNANRVKHICAAYDIELSRPEWYALYCAAGNELP